MVKECEMLLWTEHCIKYMHEIEVGKCAKERHLYLGLVFALKWMPIFEWCIIGC